VSKGAKVSNAVSRLVKMNAKNSANKPKQQAVEQK
jgi:ribosomal protein S16